MELFPAIDLFDGCAVRLYKGDYNQKTVYSDNPVSIALDFKKCGCKHIHLVDLQGAKDGTTPNLELICKIKRESGLFAEVGGGIRSTETVEKYLNSGIDRVILGTAAVENKQFLIDVVKKYGEKIAVGVDIKNGCVATKGWTDNTGIDAIEFCKYLENIGVSTIISTDISKDGAMKGTNVDLYKNLTEITNMNIIASGGVSSIDDIKALKKLDVYGAIIGKAYYTNSIDLKEAVEVTKC